MKSPKYFITIILFTLGIFSHTVAQNLTGTPWTEALESGSGTITVAYYEEDAFAYQDDNGQHTGMELEILKQFTNWLKNGKGIELEVKYQPYDSFSAFLNAVRNGEGGVIGAGNVTITTERDEFLEFSPPYLNNMAVLVTSENIPTLSALSDMNSEFRGMSAVVFEGTTHEGTLQNVKDNYFPTLQINTVKSDQAALKAASESNQILTYVDLFMYWMASNNDIPVKRHPVGDRSTEQFGFIMPEGSDWAGPMNEFFNIGAGYRSSSAYRTILMRYLGTEVTQMLELAAKNRR